MSSQVALENRLKGIESLVALALARSAGGSSGKGIAASFVWHPNGTPGEGVYVTPQSLGAALAATKGKKIVAVDTVDGAANLTMAGAPYNLNDVEFVAGGATVLAVITIESGVTFTSTTTNLAFTRCGVETTGGGTVWSPPADAFLVTDTTEILAAAGAPLIDCAGGVVEVGATGSIFGDGTNPVFVVEAAGSATVDLTSSELNVNSVGQGAAPGGALNVFVDDNSACSPTQGIPINSISQLGLNAIDGFLTADSGAVSSVTATTSGSMNRERTGQIDVSGFIGGTNSAAATITVTLLRDSTVIATYPPIVLTGAGHWAASLAINDQLFDAGPHTYSIKAVPSAGTIDVVGNTDKTLTNAFVEARER